MKNKLLLYLIFSFVFFGSAIAQVSKGGFYAGGSLNYNYNSFGTSNVYNYATGYTIYTTKDIASLTVSPEFGYFLSNKWSIGIQSIYSRNSGIETSNFYSNISTTNNYSSSDNYHSSSVGAGINVRYYCMFSNRFGFFPQFGISTLNNTVHFKYGTLGIRGSPNFVFFPIPQLGVIMGLGNIGYSLDYQTKYYAFNASLNSSISFGLNYYWGKK